MSGSPIDPSTPLRVHAFSVRDFRLIRALDLDLDDGFGRPLERLALVGPNGSGKTALLDALALALGARTLLGDRGDRLGDQVRFGAEDFELRVTLARGDQREELVAHRRDIEQPIAPFGAWDGGGPSGRWAAALAERPPRVDYFSAARPLAANDSSHAAGSTEPSRLHDLLRKLVALRFRSLSKRKPLDPSSPFLALQRFWQDFTGDPRELDVIERGGDGPDASDAIVVLRDAGRAIPDDIVTLAQARRHAPRRDDVPVMVPVDHLSSGQMALLTLAGTLLLRDEPLDVLLIDEPEQHLHPAWHFHLFDGLRRLSPQTQVLVATHSAEVLAATLSSERVLLGRNAESATRGDDDGPADDARLNDAAAE